jgi:dienelactone hydrolase
MRAVLLAGIVTVALCAEDLAPGRIINDVKCAADPSQSYALYLPSNYSKDRSWPVIFAFSPMARGRGPLERLREAAEKYGYILAGSNNSRNGDWPDSQAAIRIMPTDVTARFSVDRKRVYTAGMSGGARVAMQVALNSGGKIAGVIACSAGFPDAQPRKSVPFVIFATAGTEDFNNLEMRRLDRAVTTPHRLMIFEGGHDWLPASLGTDAIEWLEVQAMKSGLRPRDEALLDKIFAARVAEASAQPSELKALVADFEGLRDISGFAARAAEWERQKDVQTAFKKERFLEQREEQMIAELRTLENGLGTQDKRSDSLTELRDRLSDLSRRANVKDDSEDRRLARRLFHGAFVRSFERINDPEYQKLLNQVWSAQQK